MKSSFAALLAITLLSPMFGQKQELREMNRDIGLLREEIREMQKAQSDRMASIETSLKAVLDQLSATNRSVAVLEKSLRERVEKSIASQMAGLGSKVEAAAEDYRFVRETVNEINQRLGKMQLQIVDLDNAIKTMQAPPPPPSAQTPASTGPPPGLSAKTLYDDALRDKSAGNTELAIKQFTDYLTWFGNTELAPNAQYSLGEILYTNGRFDEALKAFDLVLERYPKNSKTLDAKLMKGRTLIKLGRRNEGADEFRDLVRDSPGSDAGRRARSELRALGLSPTPPASRKKK
jgi:TolA-binding protein